MLYRTSPRLKIALLFIIALVSLVQLQSTTRDMFAQGMPTASTTIYLPVVIVPAPRPSIVMTGPDDAAQLKTLAPGLTWNPSVTGSYVVELAKDTSFASLVSIFNPTVKVTDLMIGTNIVRYPTSNLSGSTQYYWRVGLQLKGESSYTYGAVRTFTMPKKSSLVFPAPPALVSPKDKGAIVGKSEALVAWTAVPNAIGYRVIVTASATGEQVSSKVINAPDTSYAVPADVLSDKAPGPNYFWQVRVLDQNGWGDYSAQSQFRWIP